MKQYTTIIPKDYIFFDEIIEQRLTKYGIRTRFNEAPEVCAFELFLDEDPNYTVEVVECENSIALFRTSSRCYQETIKKLIAALENEFHTYMIFIENFKISNQLNKTDEYSKLSSCEDETCYLDDFLYIKLIEFQSNRDAFDQLDRGDIFANALAIKIDIGLALISAEPDYLKPENKNKLLIKINAKYRDMAIKFNQPRNSLDIIDWALA